MDKKTAINVMLRWDKGGFVSGYVAVSEREAYIELTEEQALKLYLELQERFNPSNSRPYLPTLPEIPIDGPSDWSGKPYIPQGPTLGELIQREMHDNNGGSDK